MYAEARLKVAEAQPPVRVPTAPRVRFHGTRVWVVDGARCSEGCRRRSGLGTEIEIPSGLNGDESS
jgi:hypothetical protein